MPSQGVVAAPVNHPPGWGSGNLKTWKAEICLDSWRASLGRFISVITELGRGQWDRFRFSGFQKFSFPTPVDSLRWCPPRVAPQCGAQAGGAHAANKRHIPVDSVTVKNVTFLLPVDLSDPGNSLKIFSKNSSSVGVLPQDAEVSTLHHCLAQRPWSTTHWARDFSISNCSGERFKPSLFNNSEKEICLKISDRFVATISSRLSHSSQTLRQHFIGTGSA
jgi:hypothetical protein